MSTTKLVFSRKRNHDNHLQRKPLRELLKDLTYAFATNQTTTAAQLSIVLAEMQVNVTFECDGNNTKIPSDSRPFNSLNTNSSNVASIV